MTENHFRLHFSPFQINTQLFFYVFEWPPVAGGHIDPYWMTEPHFDLFFDRSSRHFRSIRIFFSKWAAGDHLGSPISPQNNRVLPLCVINGYAKYEVDQ